MDTMLTQPSAVLFIVFNLLSVLHFNVVWSNSFFDFEGMAKSMYVTSNVSIPCLVTQNPCLTFAEYANEPDRYFVNDTIFYFIPGTHYLNSSLKVRNIHHFAFRSLSADFMSTISFDPNVSIIVENCSHVEVSSVIFSLTGMFTYSLVFKQSLFIHLSNVSILGNKNGGYSSIMCHNSDMNITDSTFVDITGTLGAVVMVSKSMVVLRGNNFVRNTAVSGGAIYMTDSTLIFNTTNIFMNNCKMHTKII